MTASTAPQLSAFLSRYRATRQSWPQVLARLGRIGIILDDAEQRSTWIEYRLWSSIADPTIRNEMSMIDWHQHWPTITPAGSISGLVDSERPELYSLRQAWLGSDGEVYLAEYGRDPDPDDLPNGVTIVRDLGDYAI